ncbi:MAG TPA: hypothetical protein VHE61_06895 [Opitutaceae bacterium]|nr:hypothetical protein [Opitutaceae bacterium]
MKDREPPYSPAGLRRALRCLSLLLLPALTLDEGYAGPRMPSAFRPSAEAAPYLPVLGSPSLRFQEALPPPDLATRPAAGAPPVAALSPAESSVAVANATAARSTVAPEESAAPAGKPPSSAPKPAVVATRPAEKTPAPILPDTARPVVHPEDFLPFFEIPGTRRPNGDLIVVPTVPVPPTPGTLPPSTATYTQTPQ